MKIGQIRIDLSYEFPDDTSNEDIKEFVLNVELPGNYEEDTFEYVGIWNEKDGKWEDK